MDPFRLARDELEYELSVRDYINLESYTALDMKKMLAKIIKSEKFGTFVNNPTEQIDCPTELTICTRKVVELQALSELVDSIESNDGRRFFAKTSHVLGRLARITSETEDVNAGIKRLREELNQLETV
ncbi:hypothetical protein CBL_20269, partial [Carabus blaptoides fortunei]